MLVMMEARTAARQIVAIQNRLASETMPAGRRAFMFGEQRELWDDRFPGQSFDQIARRALART